MEWKGNLKYVIPEYEQKRKICEINKSMSLRKLIDDQYFSVSARCGANEIWSMWGNTYGEFLTPERLVKLWIQGLNGCKVSETPKVIEYHKSIYRSSPEIGAVIIFSPAYQKQAVKNGMCVSFPDLLKDCGDIKNVSKKTCFHVDGKFLVAIGENLQEAYQQVVALDSVFYRKLWEQIDEKEENMENQISRQDIEGIVNEVMKNVYRSNSIYDRRGERPKDADISIKAVGNTGKKGVFKDVKEAILEAERAQKKLIENYKLEDRGKFTDNIRTYALQNKETLARLNVEETKLGRYEDKIGKIELVANKTPGVEILTTEAKSGDEGLMIEEMGPYGVIGAVSPVTNPTETLLCNAIGMIAAGNSVVYNVHPSGKNVSAYTVDLINRAIVDAGGPENLVTMVETPTMDTLQEIIKHPAVKLLCGTGGPGLVKTLLSSGKKAIGAGAGNPPVIVDDTADVKLAAREILKGASFENNILCIAEKEVFVLNSIADDFMYEMVKEGAYVLSAQEVERIMEVALYRDKDAVTCGCSGPVTGEYHINKKWVGKDAGLFLKEIGVNPPENVRMLIFETYADHPFVQLEQMMPILPIVRVDTLEEAMELAVHAEHGNRHTASMFSRDVNNLTAFAKKIGTTIFVKNASTLAGVGFGGEGYTTFTIAGPTGEGITSAKTFTRVRRCVIAGGGFRVI